MVSRPGAAQSSYNASVAGLRGFGLALRPVPEAPTFVAGFDDLTMKGEAVEQRSCHPGIGEDAGPFTEGQVGGDDDRSAFVELAAQVEQQLTASLGEGQIAELIEDEEVKAGDQIGGPPLSFGAGLSIKLVHQVADVEEPPTPPGSGCWRGRCWRRGGFCRSRCHRPERGCAGDRGSPRWPGRGSGSR